MAVAKTLLKVKLCYSTASLHHFLFPHRQLANDTRARLSVDKEPLPTGVGLPGDEVLKVGSGPLLSLSWINLFFPIWLPKTTDTDRNTAVKH